MLLTSSIGRKLVLGLVLRDEQNIGTRYIPSGLTLECLAPTQ